MKKLFIAVLVLCTCVVKAQTLSYDTTFSNGFQNLIAKVWLPPTYYTNPTDSFQLVIFWPGQGEYGTNYADLEKYGPHAYKLRGGWDGGNALPGGRIYYPIYVSIQRMGAGYLQPPFTNIANQAIITRYRVKRNSVHITGLSAGGWSMALAATYQETLGDYSRIWWYKTLTNIEGVIPSDPYGETPAYPTRFRYFALHGNYGNGGYVYNFEQWRQDGRDMQRQVDTMNAARPGSAIYFPTDYGAGDHGYFDKFYGDAAAPDNFTFAWGTGNIYQNMMMQGDTSAGAGTPPPTEPETSSNVIYYLRRSL